MNKINILNELYEKRISVKRAYKKLYKIKKVRRAHFVKLRISIPDEKWISRLINLLFICPIPIFIIKLILNKSDRYLHDDFQISMKEVAKLINVKGAYVDVVADDKTKVLIKTI